MSEPKCHYEECDAPVTRMNPQSGVNEFIDWDPPALCEKHYRAWRKYMHEEWLQCQGAPETSADKATEARNTLDGHFDIDLVPSDTTLPEDLRKVLASFLSDLWHLCDEEGIDLEKAIREAKTEGVCEWRLAPAKGGYWIGCKKRTIFGVNVSSCHTHPYACPECGCAVHSDGVDKYNIIYR